jgi:diguanylate cyclase (GGDEF)-like protein
MKSVAGSIRWLPHLAQVTLLAAAYFMAAKASLVFAIPPGYATAVWPPSGIALAAILIFGRRVWPGVWLGAALVNLTVASSPFAAVAIGSGNTLEALAGAALIQRHIAAAPPYFDRARNVVRFVAYAAMCSTVAATVGVSSLVAEGAVPWPEFAANWGTWWHGDTAGIIIVTPLILTWSVRQEIVWTAARMWEAAAFASSLLLTTFLVFGQGNPFPSSLPLTFLILPFIIWAAFRFSRREVTTAIAAICSIAVWQTVEGLGPFALGSLNLELLVLLAFISTVVTTGLVLSAAVGERARTLKRLADAMQELQEQAHTDPLTGLANRRFLWEFLQREWIRARRRMSPLAVVMIDLDHFKLVNDTFGHDAGDQVLVDVAVLLKAHVRGSDMACRFGGEEFALVLPDATLEAVQRRAEGIRDAIRGLEPTHRGRRLGRMTASLGIALCPDHAPDPESLLRASDQALYEAKAGGRDRVVVSSARTNRPKTPGYFVLA